MNVGIPLKLFYESLGHVVTVEMKTGDSVRGTLANVEDNMNILLVNTTFTSRDGRATPLELVFIRGSQIAVSVFPDMLRYAPMFKLAKAKGQKGLGIGQQRRQMVMKAHQGALALALSVLSIAANFESGRGKIVDYIVLDPTILTHPVMTDQWSDYMGRVTGDLDHLWVTTSEDCSNPNRTEGVTVACNAFWDRFSPLQHPINEIIVNPQEQNTLRGVWTTLTTMFILGIIFFILSLVVLGLYWLKWHRHVCWILGNWLGGLAASDFVAFHGVLHAYRRCIKSAIWKALAKTHPYILVKVDATDHICWAGAVVGGVSALVLYLAGLTKVIQLQKPPVKPDQTNAEKEASQPMAARSLLCEPSATSVCLTEQFSQEAAGALNDHDDEEDDNDASSDEAEKELTPV